MRVNKAQHMLLLLAAVLDSDLAWLALVPCSPLMARCRRFQDAFDGCCAANVLRDVAM